MGPIEGVLVGLVILFYIVRRIFLVVRGAVRAVRKAFVPSQAINADAARRAAQEEMRQSVASQQPGARPPQPRTTPVRARRPDAGGPAVTDPATSGQFRSQVAQIESQESRGLAVSAPDSVATEDVPPLFRGGDDLVRAIILQEILGKPLSQRRRRLSPTEHPSPPPQ